MATLTHGGYEAEKVSDGPLAGALVIRNVPIFCACKRNDLDFDEAWVTKAVAKARRKEADDGYLPPLHIRHHEPETAMTDSVRPAGVFRVTGAQPLKLDGKTRLGVFADLIITDTQAQEEVMRMRFPYRSVEIFDPSGEPSIDSLALLDHEAPFLTLPMLHVGGSMPSGADTTIPGQMPGKLVRMSDGVSHETFRGDWSMQSHPDDGAVVASFSRGRSARLLFRAEDSMEDDKDKNYADDAEDRANMQDDSSEEKSENMEGDGMDVASIVKAIKSGSISVADMKEILAAIAEQEAEAEASEPESGEEIEPAPAATPTQEAMKDEAKDRETFAALRGRIDALEARDRERNRIDARKDAIASAMNRLSDRPLPANFRETLTKMYDKAGADGFKVYVDSFAETFAAVGDVIADEGKMAAFRSQTTGPVSDAAAKFAAQGTEAARDAARFSAEWRQLRDSGFSRIDEERYIAINMAKAGHKTED